MLAGRLYLSMSFCILLLVVSCSRPSYLLCTVDIVVWFVSGEDGIPVSNELRDFVNDVVRYEL